MGEEKGKFWSVRYPETSIQNSIFLLGELIPMLKCHFKKELLLLQPYNIYL